MLVRDCTNALFASPSPGIRALGLSGNYPDGRTGNLPIIPAHIKTKPLWREHDYFTGIKSRMQEEFSEKPLVFEPFSVVPAVQAGLSSIAERAKKIQRQFLGDLFS